MRLLERGKNALLPIWDKESRVISSMGSYRRKSHSKAYNSLFFNKITKLADEGNAFSLMYLVSYKAFNKVLPQNAIQIILGTRKPNFPDN